MTLRHAQLKAERALEHLQTLEAEIEKYYAASPWSVRRYDDMDRARHVIKIHLTDPPERIYILAGDFAHCLRCTLDHLVYALVTNATGSLATDRRIMWPVMEQRHPGKLQDRTKGMDPQARALIEQLQPHQFGNTEENPLVQLTKLDNIDKHRYLAINETWLDMFFPNVKPGDEERIPDAGEITLPLSLSKTEMRLNPRPSIWFGATDEALKVDAKRLREIYSYVITQVLPLFNPFFASAVG
jgi:hypothetical protein